MAKDFYKLKEGKILHKVVMGMSQYADYYADGWSTVKPDPSAVPLRSLDPLDGMDNDPDMKDVLKKIKSKKAQQDLDQE